MFSLRGPRIIQSAIQVWERSENLFSSLFLIIGHISLQCDRQPAVSSCWDNSFNTTLMLLSMCKAFFILLIRNINIRSKQREKFHQFQQEVNVYLSVCKNCLKNLLYSFAFTCAHSTWILDPPVSTYTSIVFDIIVSCIIIFQRSSILGLYILSTKKRVYNTTSSVSF